MISYFAQSSSLIPFPLEHLDEAMRVMEQPDRNKVMINA